MPEFKNEGIHLHWYEFIAPHFRNNFLMVLEELSRLFDKNNPSFIIVGAFSLLINRVLNYTVMWDIDLLFKNKESLFNFIEFQKNKNLKIQFIDEKLMVGESISSIHTMWSFDKKWVNVDLMLRENLFELHFLTLPIENITYSETIIIGNKEYKIDLLVAHPWNVFLDKLMSPRLETEIEKCNSFGIDIRHIFAILDVYSNNPSFWNYISRTSNNINIKEKIERNLEALNSIAGSIGYKKFNLN